MNRWLADTGVTLNGINGFDMVIVNPSEKELHDGPFPDLKDENSELDFLNSSDASETTMIRLGFSPEMTQQLDSNEVALAGKLHFDGNVTGNINDPVINGNASLDSISPRGRDLGSLTAGIAVSPDDRYQNGKLTQADGGNAVFDINIPGTGADIISVNATLTNISAANLIAALPVPISRPVSATSAQTSELFISRASNKAAGASISSHPRYGFDSHLICSRRKRRFRTVITLENLEMRSADGYATARKCMIADDRIRPEYRGKNIQLRTEECIHPESTVPAITGIADLRQERQENKSILVYDINFSGTAKDVHVNGPVRDVSLREIRQTSSLSPI